MKMEGFYNIRQASKILGVSTKTVRNRIKTGALPAVFENRNEGLSFWKIPISALEITSTIAVKSIPMLTITMPKTQFLSPAELSTTHIQLKQFLKDATLEEVVPFCIEMAQLRAELNSHFQRADDIIKGRSRIRKL